MTRDFALAPTQAAEFSGPGKRAIVLYAPDWSQAILETLNDRPTAYEAAWSYQAERRAHVLQISYSPGPTISIALIDGIHNQVFALLAKGSALVLSPYPLYKDPEGPEPKNLFDPEISLVLPELPSPLG
jgi:hypothetical protein